MTDDQIKHRLAELENIHPKEIGCRVGELRKLLTELLASRTALQKIKLTALSATDSRRGFGHIIRLCIDAGVTQHLDELSALHPSSRQ